MGISAFINKILTAKKTEAVTPQDATGTGMKFINDPGSPDHWRRNPKTASKFLLADDPDDIQVLVHEGGRRTTQSKPELLYVRTTGQANNYYKGVLVDELQLLKSVQKGTEIIYKIQTGREVPVRLLPSYINELKDWEVSPCDKCGFTELFDAPTEVMKLSFPNLRAGEVMEAFTTTCNLCGGKQAVRSKRLVD